MALNDGQESFVCSFGGLKRKGSVAAFVGGIGSGKSYLTGFLLGRYTRLPDWQTLLVTGRVSASDFLANVDGFLASFADGRKTRYTIRKKLGMPYKAKSKFVITTPQQLRERGLLNPEKFSVVIIDNADCVEREVLDLLFKGCFNAKFVVTGVGGFIGSKWHKVVEGAVYSVYVPNNHVHLSLTEEGKSILCDVKFVEEKKSFKADRMVS